MEPEPQPKKVDLSKVQIKPFDAKLHRAGAFGLMSILGGLLVSVPILVNNLAVILA